jgi:hypothetical protein
MQREVGEALVSGKWPPDLEVGSVGTIKTL